MAELPQEAEAIFLAALDPVHRFLLVDFRRFRPRESVQQAAVLAEFLDVAGALLLEVLEQD